MLSIGQFAKLVQVSARTVRYYESIGLIASMPRGENNYRYYDQALVEKFQKICELQNLGFSLDEIKHIFTFAGVDLTLSLQKKLQQVLHEIDSLRERKERLEKILSVSQKIDLKKAINDTERKQYMEAIKVEIMSLLAEKQGHVHQEQKAYLERERQSYDTPEKQDFLKAIQKCVQFAKDRNLKLGPGRGSSPSSLVLYAIGFNEFDPTNLQLYPERLASVPNPDVHIDVQFEGGQDFVNYCREISSHLKYGQINAFKMPLIDIINNVHKRIGNEIDYNQIADDSDIVMSCFRNADIEKIFLFDLSDKALVMKYENLFSDYTGLEKITTYLKNQPIYDFRDIVNITALWRPNAPEMIERIERYRLAKYKPHRYEFLAPELQDSLQKNFGLIIYHEDLIRIISHYTGWSFERSNNLRRKIQFDPENIDQTELTLFKKITPPDVADLVLEESKWAFCQPHAISFAKLTKQTAVLKTLYKEIYYDEIAKWEAQNDFVWDDIGIKLKGVSLLQN